MIEDNEKKYVYTVIAVAIVILIIVLIIIWKPLFSNTKKIDDELKSYDVAFTADYVEQAKDMYFNIAKKYIDKSNINDLKNVISSNYLNNNKISKEELENYLIKNNLLISTNASTVLYFDCYKTNGTRYVFSYKYSDDSFKEHSVHIIENKYGEYEISFEQDSYPVLNNIPYVATQDNVNYIFKEIASYRGSVVYNVTITNNSNNIFTYDLGAIDKVNVEFISGKIASLDTVIVGNESARVTVNPNSTKSFDLSFNMEQIDQTALNRVTFKNVTFGNGDTTEINLKLEEGRNE